MALRNIIGITVGLGAALGAAAFVAKKLFGSDESETYSSTFSANGGSGMSNTPATPREGLDPTLLEILACPDDKQPVIYQKEGDAERLTCTVCGKRYPVRDGIPVMLIDEAAAGPVPNQAEIDAAKALVSQGKPALVGAAASAAPAASAGPSGTSTSSAGENQSSSGG